jgi:hypothetical protein
MHLPAASAAVEVGVDDIVVSTRSGVSWWSALWAPGTDTGANARHQGLENLLELADQLTYPR